MMRELLGRAGGTCGGKGGSMHIADFSVGMLGANGVVADGVTIAVGAAQAVKLLREDRVVVAFFGDGAVNRGPLLEAFNWAVIYKLPVLFVCEDNQYAATVRTAEFTAGEGIVARAESFGIPAESIDGNDVALVFETTRRLLATGSKGRTGAHPRARLPLVRPLRPRQRRLSRSGGASQGARGSIRSRAAGALLLGNGVADEALDEARADAENRVARALAEAEAAPLPAAEEAFRDIQDVDAAWK